MTNEPPSKSGNRKEKSEEWDSFSQWDMNIKTEKPFGRFVFRNNIYVSLILSLLLVMVLYSCSRLIFYALNTDFFPDMTFGRMATILLGGFRFDLAAVLYTNMIFILLIIIPWPFKFSVGYQKILKVLFIGINSIALALNAIDFIYYRFTLRRTTVRVFKQFENEENAGALFFRFIWDYWYVVLCWILLVSLLVMGYRCIKIRGPQVKNPWVFYLGGMAVMLLCIYLFIGGVRGGFKHSTRPITISNAAAYAKVPNDVNLVLNTPFSMLRTANTEVIEKVSYFDDPATLNQHFNPIKTPSPSSENSFRSKNVVLIILESFSKEFVGAYNQEMFGGKYKGYTPFLDSLIQVGLSFQHSMANGRKSIDAMPSLIASIPSITVPYVLSHFSGNRIQAAPSLLKEKGYYSAFFHGAPNGSMGFDAFANSCGFDAYYGKDEYDNDADSDGIWGIWDHKFLPFVAQTINKFKEPFYATIFTVSSHHPFQLPKEYQNSFKGGEMDVLRTIEYTDYSLRQFFKSIEKMPWFDNTLFVFSADHASAEIALKEYNTAWGYFAIPVFFYVPNENLGGIRPEIIQQIDVMPSILGYLGYDKPYFSYGRDFFHDTSPAYAFNYLNNLYQAFAGSYMLQFDGSKSVGLYNYQQDLFLRHNLLLELPDTVDRMELKLKAFIQQYNNRMVDNQLTLPTE